LGEGGHSVGTALLSRISILELDLVNRVSSRGRSEESSIRSAIGAKNFVRWLSFQWRERGQATSSLLKSKAMHSAMTCDVRAIDIEYIDHASDQKS